MSRPSALPKLRVVPSGIGPGAAPAPTVLDAAYRDHARYVATLAHRVLGRDSDVDDVVHDVFVSAARGLGALRDAQALRGWLGVVTIRLARRRLHARRFFSLFGLDPTPDYGELAARDAGPQQRAVVARIYRELDTLPAAERLAWVLRFVEEERLEEVARLCGCSLATAKRRISAAQAALDARLGDE